MLETRDLYKDYIASIESKIAAVTVKIDQYNGSMNYLKNAIINNRAELESLEVNVEALLETPTLSYIKVKPLINNGQLTRVGHYIKMYTNAYNYLTLHKRLFEYYQKALMPYEVYLKLIASNNLEISKHILKGGIYTFGHVGRLYIREKARTFVYMGKKAKLPIDWGLSNKYKVALIENGLTPYDSKTAPDGIKWHIYHNTDFGYWFWWEMGIIKGRGFFKFYPSKFLRRYNKKGVPFTSKEEIYNTTEIGILNKMLELMKIDPLHRLNYRRPEKVKKVEVKPVNI